MITTAHREQVETVARPYIPPTVDPDQLSVGQLFSLWPPEARNEFLAELTDQELLELNNNWEFWGRPKQLPPPTNDWQYWLLLAGRGFGKTRTICQWATEQAIKQPGSIGAIVAATAADARDILIEGASGILACAPAGFTPVYEPSKRRITWPNGSRAIIFSSEKPDRLRGVQFHWFIADELAAWRYMETWDMLQFCLRLGDNPQGAIATTPRPIKVIRDLLEDPACHVTRGTTYENRDNLAAAFFNRIINRYEGTRLGRQELNAEILDDVPGALWNRAILDDTRISQRPNLRQIVVAVDPAASTGQTGIIVVGIARGTDGKDHGYVIDDVTPPAGSMPAVWAQAAVTAYHKWEANYIVGEVNHGGNMVEHTIRTVDGGDRVAYKAVRASRGKHTRAEPVSALFEKHNAHMLGFFGKLEDELCSWLPGAEDSPNRLDAMVWGFTALMLDGKKKKAPAVAPVGNTRSSSWQ